MHDWNWLCDAKGYTALNASVSADSFTQNIYQVPAVVMSTAFAPTNTSAPLQFSWHTDDVIAEYYVFMRFAEIQVLKNEIRSLNVAINGNPTRISNYEPEYLATFTVYTMTPVNGGTIELELEKTEQSTLPPILNAIEIYKAIEFS